jgi:hypothetical protein
VEAMQHVMICINASNIVLEQDYIKVKGIYAIFAAPLNISTQVFCNNCRYTHKAGRPWYARMHGVGRPADDKTQFVFVFYNLQNKI